VLHLVRILTDVDAGHDRLAFVRAPQALEDLHRGRLAGAVGAEQPEDLSLFDAKRDPVNRHQAPVALSQSVDDDREPLRLGAETGIAWSRNHAHARDIIAAVGVWPQGSDRNRTERACHGSASTRASTSVTAARASMPPASIACTWMARPKSATPSAPKLRAAPPVGSTW